MSDVIVVGLGAAGAATLMQLASRGIDVVGIDRYAPPHALGSTHGDTRITRQAIGEGEAYAPLALHSHQIWRELEEETGAQLLTQNGGIVIESVDPRPPMPHRRNFLDRTIACAERYSIAHELLTAADVTARFPQFGLAGDERAYHEPGAGLVRPEACVTAQLEVAARRGASVHCNERVLSVQRSGGGLAVRTDTARYSAGHVVLSAGPWLPELVPKPIGSRFAVYRQVIVWFALRPNAIDHSPDAMPVFIWGLADGRHLYGFPAVDGAGGGIKCGTEQFAATTTPDDVQRDVRDEEVIAMHSSVVAGRLPATTPRPLKALSCLYTMTPDGDFVVDRHPELDDVTVISACSGHGFKHSAAIGDHVAQWITDDRRPDVLAPFAFDRAARVPA